LWLFFKVRYFSQGQSKKLPTPLFACDCRQTILFAENILDTSYSFLNRTRIFFRKYELPSDPWTVCSNDTAFWHHVQLSDAFFSAWTLGSDMMLGQRTLPHASDTRATACLFLEGGRSRFPAGVCWPHCTYRCVGWSLGFTSNCHVSHSWTTRESEVEERLFWTDYFIGVR
jgi:hypothetical protein